MPTTTSLNNYNNIALQEIGIRLNSGNLRNPHEKPAIIYFERDTTFLSFRRLEQL